MSHIHNVYDTSSHFIIDPTTLRCKNAKGETKTLAQYDHNSARITFELPLFIDGHNMSLCDKVEVHYLNLEASATKQNPGLYKVDDLKICEEDENTVICSWLVSENATQLAGSLNFLVSFSCTNEDKTTYRWNTDVCSDITIVKGYNNGEIIVKEYPDILERWRNDVLSGTVQYDAFGNSFTLSDDGKIDLTPATADTLGGVKVGDNINVDEDGVISIDDYIPSPSTAEVGQTIVVKAVDDNGKPTEWETVDLSQHQMLIDYTTTEPVSEIKIPLSDDAIEAFNKATQIWMHVYVYPDETATDTTGWGSLTCKIFCGWVMCMFFDNLAFVPTAENAGWSKGSAVSYLPRSSGLLNSPIGSTITSYTVGGNPGYVTGRTDINDIYKYRDVCDLVLTSSVGMGTGTQIRLIVR